MSHDVKFSSLGKANNDNVFWVGLNNGGQLVIKIKIKTDPHNEQWKYHSFPNGIVQGRVRYDAKRVGYNYPMRGQDGLFFNICSIEKEIAWGIMKKIVDGNKLAVILNSRASAPLSDLGLMADIAVPCIEADIREFKSTSSPSPTSKAVKRHLDTQLPPAVKSICLSTVPPVEIIATGNFAHALYTATTMFNCLPPELVFFVYPNAHGPEILHFNKKSVLEIRQYLKDNLWESQTGGWCGLHSLNFLRCAGTTKHTCCDMYNLQKELQKEYMVTGNLADAHTDMVMQNGWITVDIFKAFMTRVMGLSEPSPLLPSKIASKEGKTAVIRKMFNVICESSLPNNAVAMVVIAGGHYYVLRKIGVKNIKNPSSSSSQADDEEEKMYIAFLDSNYNAKK